MKNAHWICTILFIVYLLFVMNYSGVGVWELNQAPDLNFKDAISLKRKIAFWMLCVTLALWIFKFKNVLWDKLIVNAILIIAILFILLSFDQRFYKILSGLTWVGFLSLFFLFQNFKTPPKSWKEDGPLDDI